MDQQLFKVTIDNITIEVVPGTTILQAARKIGGEVTPPAMCYYSKLKGTGGKCRTCLVEVSKGSEKDPRPMPKLVASCRTAVMDGMEATAAIKKLKPEIKIIVLSMVGDFGTVNKMIESGADGYILKNTDSNEFFMSFTRPAVAVLRTNAKTR